MFGTPVPINPARTLPDEPRETAGDVLEAYWRAGPGGTLTYHVGNLRQDQKGNPVLKAKIALVESMVEKKNATTLQERNGEGQVYGIVRPVVEAPSDV